ncbi:hypothetical protein FIM08_02575 [SAR202 cluster bacterium AC-647-N09_OGT_505m]|nr:hypothetical protein [SAR202 cluster bacterium AC-647-N09_OGT_505m]
MIRRNKLVSIMSASVLGILLIFASSACSEEESKGPVILIEQDWNGNTVTTALAKLILEEEMGYTVETKFAPADSAQMFEGLASGEMHWVCCNWPSFSAALLEEYADTGKVTRQGPVGIKGTSHMYVPRYVIEGDSERGIDAMAPDLKSYADLNKYKDLFATADTRPKGRFLDFTPGWDYRNEERLEALGVDFEVVFTGSEAASFAELDAAHKRGEPIILVVWTPHWAPVKYDLVAIDLPAHSDCYPVTEKFDCGYAVDDVKKLTWPGLKEDMPKAYEFLENFQITNDQQTSMVITKTDESKTDAEAARLWKDANEHIWKTWIP